MESLDSSALSMSPEMDQQSTDAELDHYVYAPHLTKAQKEELRTEEKRQRKRAEDERDWWSEP